MKKILYIAIIAFSIVACNSGSNNKKNTDNTQNANFQEKQLNISILLDLSDRINPINNPYAKENDIEDIKTITEFFKSNMERLGAYKAKGKIRIFFSPTPQNSNINSIVSRLIIDCSRMDNRGRKEVYDTLTELYSQNLEQIYQETIETSGWEGSDIWRFFNDDVKDFCIEKDTSYRNILIIFTDGYLYHPQTMLQDNNNRFTFLLSSNLSAFRNRNWKQMIENTDFGILTERKDLNDLEVLVLEVKAENPNNKIDEDILKFLWKKWFKEMNISHEEVYHSDLPANTKTRIENFLKQK